MTTSAPVVTVTVRPPVNAVGADGDIGGRDVGLLTVTELTVMPELAPKPTVVTPGRERRVLPGQRDVQRRALLTGAGLMAGGRRGGDWTHAENSDVLFDGSVAVAVTTVAGGRGEESEWSRIPVASVIDVVAPRNVCALAVAGRVARRISEELDSERAALGALLSVPARHPPPA